MASCSAGGSTGGLQTVTRARREAQGRDHRHDEDPGDDDKQDDHGELPFGCRFLTNCIRFIGIGAHAGDGLVAAANAGVLNRIEPTATVFVLIQPTSAGR